MAHEHRTVTPATEPDDLQEADFEISNYDGGQIPANAEGLLRGGKHWVSHPARDHWGCIWFADDEFHERVMRFGSHVATVSNASLPGLIREVNDRYGHD